MDDIDGSFFDHIDDLLDFPADDVVAGASTLPAASVSCHSFPSIWPAEADSAELSLPCEDSIQFEWQPNFVEDFSCGSLTLKKVEPPCTTVESAQNQFQTSSPVSVLESSSSCEKTAPRSPEIYIPVPCGRPRSKRPRPVNFNPRPVMQLISPASSSVGENTTINAASKAASDSENFAESRPVIKTPKQASAEHKKKKKRIRLSIPLGSADLNQNAPSQAIRKCMHCEITKTPQWRAGPLGPKTLCNACGVRYKSGRLFPEYRPAASPTFCPSLHSNSHQKVLQMRSKAGEITASSELIPNTISSITLEYMPGINGGIGEIDDDDDDDDDDILSTREGLLEKVKVVIPQE